MKQHPFRRILAGCTALALTAALSACGPRDTPNLPGTVRDLTADAPGVVVDVLPLEDEAAVQFTHFSLNLINRAVQPGKNTLLSPMSVLTALGMTANGADGETLAQMEQVLGQTSPMLNSQLLAYWQSLPQGPGGTLRSANSIWLIDDPAFQVEPDFLQTNIGFYQADLYQAPFDKNTCRAINQWVSSRTDKMIPEILDEISEDTVMYLINALAFEGEWPEPYLENQVSPAPFHAPDGDKTVEFLRGEESQYLESADCTGFLKPYKGGTYAFAALLPREGLTPEELLAGLDGESLHRMLKEPVQAPVKSTIPKFDTEFNVELSPILAEMGMPLALSTDADFSRLGHFKDFPIYIGRVLHKTFLSLGEKGTRAGAATAVAMDAGAASFETPVKTVTLDRPFVYMLIDLEHRVPFFLGVMNNPA